MIQKGTFKSLGYPYYINDIYGKEHGDGYYFDIFIMDQNRNIINL